MKGILLAIYYGLSLLGGVGLLLVGILDSSFLFMPLGNDLLMLAMTAENPKLLLYYAAMASVGSALGSLLIDWIARKGGEQGLTRILSPKRIEFVKSRVKNHAGWALAVASLMPPPFPFTPFVAAAAAFQYPRSKLLSVIAGARMVRFTAVGLLAMFFGGAILRAVDSPTVQVMLIGLVAVSVLGSVLSVLAWIRRSRNVEPSAQARSVEA